MSEPRTDPVLVSASFLDRSAADLSRFARMYVVVTCLLAAFASALCWFALSAGVALVGAVGVAFVVLTGLSAVVTLDIRREARARRRELENLS